MYDEDDLLPISALQHLLFCERQCALIHIEGLWAENRLTVEGRHLHDKAHAEKTGPRGGGRRQTRDGTGSTRALALRSLRLGLAGMADVVEFHPPERPGAAPTPFPVEYKRGRPKRNGCDTVQLCAQALCLEEMLGVGVPGGAIFYGRTRRRLDVAFDARLRAQTETAAARLRALIASGRTPIAAREKKCDRCSLLDLCLPARADRARSAAGYLDRLCAATVSSTPPTES
ncbi:MAG TPA: CRISPR-associated protein Cas4 [Phycisphaerales bacterium]|nr:CRISPR-associated protein Cas4 [Phycisphaerales bacterium]